MGVLVSLDYGLSSTPCNVLDAFQSPITATRDTVMANSTGPRKRIQRGVPGHNVLDRRRPAMGLDPDLLVLIPGPGEFRGARVWRDGVLVVVVCSCPLSTK